MNADKIDPQALSSFREGCVIPAMPLALDSQRRHDEARQRALVRYYIDAGVGGMAVGVHSTQFEIREPRYGLFKPVLSIVSEEIESWTAKRGRKILKVAGICGDTSQALEETQVVLDNAYHACLLSLAALKGCSTEALLKHCKRIAEEIPIIGFYLQPSVGGADLPYEFWRAFAEIPNVIGIKMAPFNRYKTIDVVRAVCESGRDDLTLYTGNDDNIVADLLTPFRFKTASGERSIRIKGGLLGHWAVWTSKAVRLLDEIQSLGEAPDMLPSSLLRKGIEITDANAAFFDAANGFAGCIPGIHEVLRRQGLLAGTWCLNPQELLSPGQAEEIDRVYAAYPELNDDSFVGEHLHEWLS
ncbi:MAG: dihydrodipicolinate synthase family protein [Lentisphaerae bacterium GWF2_52_8]|nr:MAG: dihydrodipicolinate synthase family protein [Lentisphaerae bacterium GWF2_52_8]